MFTQPPQVKRAQPLQGKLIPNRLPSTGINARDPAVMMAPTDAIDLVNVLTNKYGLSSRGGYQWYAYDLPGNENVETIMSYYPATAGVTGITRANIGYLSDLPTVIPPADIDLTGNLFACTNLNIYDVTAGGGGPWIGQTGLGVVTSNLWTWRNFQNAGGNFLIACNNDGGYVVYGESGFSPGFSDGFSTQATGFTRIVEGNAPGEITGINPDQFCYVMVWKQRIWFIEKDSSRAWYLPVAQITGEVKQFDFGTQFRHGGHLTALVNWTLDGGEGIDDYLVAVSSEGDVVIYKGYDPDNAAVDPAAFQLHGVWYVGALPYGFRQVDPYGGDVYILSAQGITALSSLVADRSGTIGIGSISKKINPLLAEYIRASNRSPEWQLKLLPSEELIIVDLPQIVTSSGVGQLAYAIPNDAWHRFAQVPVACYANHDSLCFGGGSIRGDPQYGGKVFLLFANAADNVNPYVLPYTGTTIKCRVVPAYSGFDNPGMWKSFPMIRPHFLSVGQVPLRITILVDYGSPSNFSLPTLPPPAQDLWNIGLWDIALWSGSGTPNAHWYGCTGAGFAATVQLDYESYGNTRLTSIDWWTVDGGAL